jgi:phenylalanyl-tRNA synthetase beta chain
MLSYSFVPLKDFDVFGLDKENVVKLLNPISEELAVMRTSLIPSIVRAVSYNLNRKNMSARLFELAKCYNAKQTPLTELPTENNLLAFALFGENEDFFTAKGVVDCIISYTCFGQEIKYFPSDVKCLHPTRSADIIVNGKYVGSFGQLEPILSESLGIDKPVFIAEIKYDELKNLFVEKIVFNPISKFPSSERDIAIVVEDKISCQEIIDVIKSSGGENLKNIKLFDIYKGENIGANKKSMAFNILFSSNERTLTVEEVDASIKSILDQLNDKLNAELR